MKKLFLAIITLIFISCDTKKPEVVEEPIVVENEVKKEKPNKLIIIAELKYSQSEDIKLFATNVFINNNRSMNINITEKVNKSDTFNNVTLDFPDNIKPDYQLGINLGVKIPKTIEIKNMNVSFGDSEFSIQGTELNDYFTFNKFLEYNPENGLITTNLVDGKLNPIMFFRRKIIDQL